jgi:hypothetical protein
MAVIRTRHLFTMSLQIAGLQPIGMTPSGNRRIALIAGDTFEGERLRGTVLPGGAGWNVTRPDGATTFDARLVLQTDDGATIGMIYRGMRHGPAEVMQRLDRGDNVDPSEYYFRAAIVFETAATAAYDWLSRIFAIGAGHRRPEGPLHEIFEEIFEVL